MKTHILCGTPGSSDVYACQLMRNGPPGWCDVTIVRSTSRKRPFPNEISPGYGMVSFLAVGVCVYQSGRFMLIVDRWPQSVRSICAVVFLP